MTISKTFFFEIDKICDLWCAACSTEALEYMLIFSNSDSKFRINVKIGQLLSPARSAARVHVHVTSQVCYMCTRACLQPDLLHVYTCTSPARSATCVHVHVSSQICCMCTRACHQPGLLHVYTWISPAAGACVPTELRDRALVTAEMSCFLPINKSHFVCFWCLLKNKIYGIFWNLNV